MHKPGHLRESLQEYLDSEAPGHEFKIEHDGEEKPLDWLLGQLWNCTERLSACWLLPAA